MESEVAEALRQAESLLRQTPGNVYERERRLAADYLAMHGAPGVAARTWFSYGNQGSAERLLGALELVLRNGRLLGSQATKLAETLLTLADWDRSEQAVSAGCEIGLRTKLFAILPGNAGQHRVAGTRTDWRVQPLEADSAAIPVGGIESLGRWLDALARHGDEPDAILIGHELPRPQRQADPNILGMFGPFAVECFRWFAPADEGFWLRQQGHPSASFNPAGFWGRMQ
jgi:hypothetical protein